MNVGEYGLNYRLNTNYDMSAFTGLSLAFTRPDGTVITKTSPSVAVVGTDLDTPLGTFAANHHIVYTFVDGDLTLIGDYSVRLTYSAAGKRLISGVAFFTVMP